AKATGAAKYSYDVNLKNQLIAKGLGCPHAHCRIKSIDVAPALKISGVVYAEPVERQAGRPVKSGDEIEFQVDLLIIVAAETEAAAREGLNAVKIEYEQLPVFVQDSDVAAAKAAGRAAAGGARSQLEKEPDAGENEQAFAQKEVER